VKAFRHRSAGYRRYLLTKYDSYKTKSAEWRANPAQLLWVISAASKSEAI